jgi:hypothetical protein
MKRTSIAKNNNATVIEGESIQEKVEEKAVDASLLDYTNQQGNSHQKKA